MLTTLFLVVVALLVPFVCAVVLFYVLRRILRRRDWTILLTAGVAGFVLHARENAYGYGYWTAGLVGFGPGDPEDVPVISMLCMTAVLAGTAGLALGQAVGSPIAALSRLLYNLKKFKDVLDGSWIHRKELVADGLIPRRGRRKMLKHRASNRVPLSLIPAVRGPHATEKSRRTPLQEKAIPLGLGARDRPVWLGVQEMGMHGAVVGSTGSGKSVTLMWIVGAALDMGYDVTVLDMKEDTEAGGLRDFLRAYAGMHRVAIQEIALGDQRPTHWFNVLDGMSADEAFDTIMTLVEFDDAYWQALNRKVLRQVTQLCYESTEVAPHRFARPTMLEIGKILEHGDAMRRAVKERIAAIDRAHGTGYCAQRYANVLRPSRDESTSAA
ncbi:helicase HerA domain-containing protein, partial [Actinomadura adrarensis]